MNIRPYVAANLALALALEMAAFSAVGYGAFHLVDSTPASVLLAAGAVTGSGVLWGLFAAPRAPRRHPIGVITVKTLVFGAGTAALSLNAHPILGVLLGTAVALNALALHGTRYGYTANA